MELRLEQLEDIKSTITWLLDNGDYTDLETSYNIAMNSINELDDYILAKTDKAIKTTIKQSIK